MVPQEETLQPSSIAVVSWRDGKAEGRRLYQPIPADVLVSTQPFPFDVYTLTEENRLAFLVGKGNTLPAEKREEIRQGKEVERYYIPQNQKDKFLQFEEDVIEEILEDAKVSTRTKCVVLHNLTNNLSQKLFDEPNAQMIQRQRENVFRIVDFAFSSPDTTRNLLALTHHDYYTYTHSVNVGLYALTLAGEYFQKPQSENHHNLHEMATGFFLHDVGKSQIASEIINKNGPLTQEEWVEIKKHPVYGCELLEREQNLTPETAIIVRQHHEKMNGKGYPDGKAGEEVHPYARVCAVADAYDALTTRRAYKDALSPFEALSVMKNEMTGHFDPACFSTFVRLLQRRS